MKFASKTNTQPHSVRRLLCALAAFELVRDRGAGSFELTDIGQCLRADSPCSVRPLILMYGSEHALQMFSHLEECIATGKSAFEIAFGSASGYRYFESRPDLAQVFNDGMSVASKFTGPASAAGSSAAEHSSYRRSPKSSIFLST
jgi:hypothetical protein